VKINNNGSWWDTKLKGNIERDRDTNVLLERAGWRVLRVWEHEPANIAADRVEETLLAVLHASRS
jgi:DNA mismatch endonuclease (patch repair protein)